MDSWCYREYFLIGLYVTEILDFFLSSIEHVKCTLNPNPTQENNFEYVLLVFIDLKTKTCTFFENQKSRQIGAPSSIKFLTKK